MEDFNKISPTLFQAGLKSRKNREKLLILLVEDQKFSRLLLKSHLSKNYKVIDVDTGEKGLLEYVTQVPDIIFLDVELPNISGHEVAELISKLDKDAYVVMVTANNYPKDVEKAKANNAKGFIVKPYTAERIYRSIEEYLNKNVQKGKK